MATKSAKPAAKPAKKPAAKKAATKTKAAAKPVPVKKAAVKADGRGQKWLDGKEPKRIVFVPNKIINIVV